LRFALDITIESYRPTPLPILGVVFVNAGAVPQKAVKLASRRVDYDPNVSAPNHQVTRLRLFHSAKVIRPTIKIP
jgi:hypothetical protein